MMRQIIRAQVVKYCSPLLGVPLLCFSLFPAVGGASGGVCAEMPNNLRLGDSGQDVYLLQVALNVDPKTRVSDLGIGSPGQETTYFGQKTLLAVKRFQELYAADILVPVKLSSGSGYVGERTRTKLRALCDTNLLLPDPSQNIPHTPVVAPIDVLSEGSTSTIPTNSIKPYIMYLDKNSVPVGGTVAIRGGGYDSAHNDVHVGSTVLSGVLVGGTYGTLNAKLPTDISPGKYDVWVKNSKGESNKTFVVVTHVAAIPPRILSFTPTSGQLGTQVVITGENFSQDWNEIVVGGQNIRTSSTDGKTLMFTATLPIPGVDLTGHIGTKETPLWFYVMNTSGISNLVQFHLKI